MKATELHTSGAKRKQGQSSESGPSTWRWRRGVRRGQGSRTKDQAGPSWTSNLTFKTISLVENMKDIYMVTKSTNVYDITTNRILG